VDLNYTPLEPQSPTPRAESQLQPTRSESSPSRAALTQLEERSVEYLGQTAVEEDLEEEATMRDLRRTNIERMKLELEERLAAVRLKKRDARHIAESEEFAASKRGAWKFVMYIHTYYIIGGPDSNSYIPWPYTNFVAVHFLPPSTSQPPSARDGWHTDIVAAKIFHLGKAEENYRIYAYKVVASTLILPPS
jgi:hypothetical protein